MKNLLILVLFIPLVGVVIYMLNRFHTYSPTSSSNRSLENSPTSSTISIAKIPMRIFSSAFENNQSILAKYSCDGKNVNPPLSFSDVSPNAKSLVLIVDDPDAPVGTWVHWVVYNIPPTTNNIVENSVPSGSVQAITSSQKASYGGPCPPSGTHRYFFKLYALDIVLPIDSNANKSSTEQKMQGHIIDQAQIIGLYSRK